MDVLKGMDDVCNFLGMKLDNQTDKKDLRSKAQDAADVLRMLLNQRHSSK